MSRMGYEDEASTPKDEAVQLVKLPNAKSATVFEIQDVLSPDACDRASEAVSEAFDQGRTTDRGVSLPTQDVMVSSLPQRSQDEIREALERAGRRAAPSTRVEGRPSSFQSARSPGTARRASLELPADTTLEFNMARAFVIVYDAGNKGQKGLKKHTDGRKEGVTILLLISTPKRDFDGGGTRFFPSVLESSFDACPGAGSTVVFPSDTLQHEGIPIKRGRRLLVCVFATKKKAGEPLKAAEVSAAAAAGPASSKADDLALAQECACAVS